LDGDGSRHEFHDQAGPAKICGVWGSVSYKLRLLKGIYRCHVRALCFEALPPVLAAVAQALQQNTYNIQYQSIYYIHHKLILKFTPGCSGSSQCEDCSEPARCVASLSLATGGTDDREISIACQHKRMRHSQSISTTTPVSGHEPTAHVSAVS
jgi:hypothetical protein